MFSIASYFEITGTNWIIQVEWIIHEHFFLSHVYTQVLDHSRALSENGRLCENNDFLKVNISPVYIIISRFLFWINGTNVRMRRITSKFKLWVRFSSRVKINLPASSIWYFYPKKRFNCESFLRTESFAVSRPSLNIIK